MDLSVVEQRYRVVLEVQAGARIGELAARVGVSRQTVHEWLRRYRAEGLAGLADRSRRPRWCPHQVAAEIEVEVCETRRAHPRWGAKRIAYELARRRAGELVVSPMTAHRVLVRNGLLPRSGRRRRREDYRRWERDAPMALWQLDIVGGVLLVDGGEVKVVTGVDDHSRFCVLAAAVARATGRAVCLAFAAALRRYGVPEEVLTDNGKQFTARFGAGGEVLFDRICRDNGIAHRLTQPSSPTTTGKVERFHQSLRRELLTDHPPFADVAAVQAALDEWVAQYNSERPHQSLDMAVPASRFLPAQEQVAAAEKLVPLRLPATLTAATSTAPADPQDGNARDGQPPRESWRGGPVEVDRVVPASGNMFLAGRQFWLGPARAGMTVTFWADLDVIHLLIGGARIKSLRSHLSVTDLGTLAARGGRPAGPPPIPPPGAAAAIEVDRTVNATGLVGLGGRQVLAAEILAGRRVGVRLDGATLLVFDPDTRQLLRARPNPLTPEQAYRLQGARPAGPPPVPSSSPVRVQRRVTDTGVITVCRQTIALGRDHAGATVSVLVAEDALTVEVGDQTRLIRRTNSRPVVKVKANRPRKVASVV